MAHFLMVGGTDANLNRILGRKYSYSVVKCSIS